MKQAVKEVVKRVPGVQALRRLRVNKWRRGPVVGDLVQPVDGSELSDTVEVAGWALATDGRDVLVDVSVNGRPAVTVQPRLPSGSLMDLFSGIRGASHASFLVRIPAAQVGVAPGDRAAVTVTARTVGEHPSSLALGVRQVTRLTGLRPHSRGDYGAEWDAAAQSLIDARVSVYGSSDEGVFHESGVATAAELVRVCSITKSDVVLEIGCGVGRIGSKLAPQCREWIGGDVSRAMVEHTRKVMGTQTNFRLVHLNGRDLDGIESASVDVVYCSAVFMHLDEWDRFRYVTEAFRTLRPGGRVYVDNMNLLGEEGWAQFLELSTIDPLNRPTRIGKTSTPQELEHYVTRAGFTDVQVVSGPLFVTCWGRKPEAV